METYNEVYLRVRRVLKNAGIEQAEMEARFIVAGAMGKTREQMLAMSNIYATDDVIRKKIEDSVQRRLNGEPLAYIIGDWEFYGLNIKINKHVLIPRIDTELLVSQVIKTAKKKVWKTRILDICTGSGCIGLALAKSLPNCNVVMADKSKEALAVCKQNVNACNLNRNTTVVETDVLKDPPPLFGTFDILVSNPPYIPTGDIETLESSVKDFEPHAALDGGEDGLMFHRAIIGKWTRILKPGGDLALELGIGQVDEVRYIMRQNGFLNIDVYKDTLGIDRVIVGKR